MRTPESLLREVRWELKRARYEAFRQALRHAGYLPHSIEIAVQKNRKWIETGSRYEK